MGAEDEVEVREVKKEEFPVMWAEVLKSMI